MRAREPGKKYQDDNLAIAQAEEAAAEAAAAAEVAAAEAAAQELVASAAAAAVASVIAAAAAAATDEPNAMSTPAEAEPAAAQPAALATTRAWCYLDNERVPQGPFAEADFLAWYAQGLLPLELPVCNPFDPSPEWARLDTLVAPGGALAEAAVAAVAANAGSDTAGQ